MKNVAYGKKMENLREKKWCKACIQWKRLFEMDIKTKLHVKKIFDNNLVAIQKSKVTLRLNKPEYVGMYILDLIKILMYEFHYDNIEINMATEKKN